MFAYCIRGSRRRTLCISMYVRTFQADFPLFHLIESRYPLLVSGSMHALDGLWSERTDALQTRSHTLCLCAKRKEAEKKELSLHPGGVHSDLPSVSSSILPSTSQIGGSVAPLLSAHQCETTLWKRRMSRFTSCSIQALLWPREGNCFMHRRMQTLHTISDVTTSVCHCHCE